MRNKVELLRALQYTKEDLENYGKIDEIADFSEKDKEFMESFKKIYELGLGELEKFINKLDEEGKELDEYSIQYYVNQLLNGPLANFVRELIQDKNYFRNFSDSLGVLANNYYTFGNTTVLREKSIHSGLNLFIINKSPQFIISNTKNLMENVEKMFRENLLTSTDIDNTLPIIDKKNKERYEKEDTGEWVLNSNGSYLVKDSYIYNVIKNVSDDIIKKLEEKLGEENFRIFKDKRGYNSFKSETNDSITSNWEIEKSYKLDDLETTLKLDIFKNAFDSFKEKTEEFLISNLEKDKKINLHTNIGQLED